MPTVSPQPDPKAWAHALGSAVRERRKTLALTQLQLADLAGCGPAFLYALEKGKPTLRMDKVLDVLSVLGLRLRVEPGHGGFLVDEALQ